MYLEHSYGVLGSSVKTLSNENQSRIKRVLAWCSLVPDPLRECTCPNCERLRMGRMHPERLASIEQECFASIWDVIERAEQTEAERWYRENGPEGAPERPTWPCEWCDECEAWMPHSSVAVHHHVSPARKRLSSYHAGDDQVYSEHSKHSFFADLVTIGILGSNDLRSSFSEVE